MLGRMRRRTVGLVTPDGRLTRYRFNARLFRTEHHLPFGRSLLGLG
jgi:YD repeat-containing protein